MYKCQITIPEADADLLKKLGFGNLSTGIRRMIEERSSGNSTTSPAKQPSSPQQSGSPVDPRNPTGDKRIQNGLDNRDRIAAEKMEKAATGLKKAMKFEIEYAGSLKRNPEWVSLNMADYFTDEEIGAMLEVYRQNTIANHINSQEGYARKAAYEAMTTEDRAALDLRQQAEELAKAELSEADRELFVKLARDRHAQ